jgi:predicted permease
MDRDLGLGELGRLLLIVFVMQLIGYFVAALVARLFPGERERTPVFELLMSMGNTMFIALPIVQMIYGAAASFYVALSCLPFNVLLYTYGVYRLSKSHDGGVKLGQILSPPLISTLVSILVILLGLPVPGAVRSLISAMSGATMPLSMLVIGASLGSVSLLDAFKNGRLSLVSAVRLLLVPLVTWAVLRLFIADPVLLMTMVIVAACPSAVLVTVMSVQYDRDAVFTAAGTLQNTALSILTIPLLIYFLN